MNSSKQSSNQLEQLEQAVKEERLRRRILHEHKKMQQALFLAIDEYWENMSEEERKTAIHLGSLNKDLGQNLKETFDKETN